MEPCKHEQPGTRFSGFVLVAVTVVISAVLGLLLPANFIFALTAEGGAVEALSAYLWIALGASTAVFVIRGEQELAPAAVLAFLAGARELDAHLRFTSQDISDLSYWFDTTMPLMEKLVVFAIILPVAVYLLHAILFSWSKFSARLLRGDPVAYSLLALLVFVLFLRIIDILPNALPSLANGSAMPISVPAVLRAVEEIGELVLPVLGFLTLWQYRRESGALGAEK